MNKKAYIEKLNRNKRRKWPYIIGLILLFIGLLLAFSVKWIYDTYGNITIYSILYLINSPMSGTDSTYIISYIKQSLLPVLAIMVLIIFLTNNFYRKNIVLIVKKASKKMKITLFPFMWLRTVALLIGIITVGVSCTWGYYRTGLNIYIQNTLTVSNFYEEYYVDPATAKLEFPEKKRNLIYLSVESLEKTLESKENDGNKEPNHLPYCTQLQNKYIAVENEKGGQGYIVEGGGWTMGAMVSQMAGIPLLFVTNSMEFNEDAQFLSGAYSIGEILKEQGYYNEYITGADKAFAGAGLFLTQHGDYEILDINAAIEQGYLPEGYHKNWGYEDAKMFEILKQEITEKYNDGILFNIMASTLDTHSDEAYICELCDPQIEEYHEKTYRCIDKQIGEFVEWFEQQPFFEDTTLVITGDHMSMSPTYFTDCDNYDRTIYSVFINAQVENKEYTKTYTTLDMYPSTLAAMGVRIEGDRLGVGTNIFSNTPTYIEIFGKSDFNDRLAQNNTFYKENLVKGNIEDVLGTNEDEDKDED